MSQAIDIIVKGGIVMIPLLACSLISLALTIERLIFWGRIKSQQAVRNIALVKAGEFDKALKAGRNSPQPIARVLAAGLAHRNPAPAKAMEAAAQAQSRCSSAGLARSTPSSLLRRFLACSARWSA